MKENDDVVWTFCWRCCGTTASGEAAVHYIHLIRMLLINSCMMCRESLNESEEIVHDSACFSLNSLVPDLCPASLSLSISASASLSPKAVVPPTPFPHHSPHSSLLHRSVHGPQRQIVACGDLMKQCRSINGNFCCLPHELWCMNLHQQRVMNLS